MSDMKINRHQNHPAEGGRVNPSRALIEGADLTDGLANVIIPRNGIRTQSRSIEGRASRMKGGHKTALTETATKIVTAAKRVKLS